MPILRYRTTFRSFFGFNLRSLFIGVVPILVVSSSVVDVLLVPTTSPARSALTHVRLVVLVPAPINSKFGILWASLLLAQMPSGMVLTGYISYN